MTNASTPAEPATRAGDGEPAGARKPGGGPGSRNLLSFLKDIPAGVKALDAAGSAVLALLTSRLYVPDQFQYLPKSSFGLAALAVLASWVWYHLLKQHVGSVILAAMLLLVGLILLDQRFVRNVPSSGTDESTSYLVGTQLSDLGKKVSAALGDPSDATIIAQAGPDQIPVLWDQYTEVSLAYTVVFCAFVIVGTLAVAGGLSYVARE